MAWSLRTKQGDGGTSAAEVDFDFSDGTDFFFTDALTDYVFVEQADGTFVWTLRTKVEL